MTEEGTTVSRFVTEREWFRLQYDRYVGPPPDQSNEPKFKDVFAEIRRKAQDRRVKEAKYIKEVPLRDEDVTYLDWKAAPPMVYCSCPQTKCICNSNKLLDDQSIPTGKRYEANIFQRIFGCCCSYAAPEPAGTLIPRLQMAARTEMAVTNAMLERGLMNERGPEFCMSGCQKFYLNENQQLKAPRSQSKSDIHCVAEIRIMRDEFERLKEYAESGVVPSQEQLRKISENCQLHGIQATKFSSSTLSNSKSLQMQDPYKPLPQAYAGGENACPCQQRNLMKILENKKPPQTRLKTDIGGTNEMKLPDCINSSNTCCRKKETVRRSLKKVYCECKRYIRRERIIEMRRQRRLEIEHRNDIKRKMRLERENVRKMKRETKLKMKLEREKMRELRREMRNQKKLEKKTNKQAPNTKENKPYQSKNKIIEATHVWDEPKLIPTKTLSFDTKEKEISLEEDCQMSLDKVREVPTDKHNCSLFYKYADLQSEQSVSDNNNILHSCDSIRQSPENKPNKGYLVRKESPNVQASYKHTLAHNCDVPKLIPTKTLSFETKEKQISLEEDCQISLDKIREIATVSDKHNCFHFYKYADLQSEQSVPDNYNNNILHSYDSLLQSPKNKPNKGYLVGKESQNMQASHIQILKHNCNVPKLTQTKTHSFETKEKQVSMEEDSQITLDKVREIPRVLNKYNCSHNFKYANLQSIQSMSDNYNNNFSHSCDSLLRSPEIKSSKGFLVGKENKNIHASFVVSKTIKNYNNFSCECNFFKNHYTQCILSDFNVKANNKNATKYINVNSQIYQKNIGAFDIREAINKNITTKENFVNVSSSQLPGTVTESKQKKTSDKNVGYQYAKELVSKEVLTFNSEQQNRPPSKVKSEDHVLNLKKQKLVSGKYERPRDVSIHNILYASQNIAVNSKEMLNNQKSEREGYRNIDCECKILDCSIEKKDGVTQPNDVVSYIPRHEADEIKHVRKKSENVKSKKNIKKQLNINKSIKVQKPKNRDIKCECSYFSKESILSFQDKLTFNSEHNLGDTSRVKDDKIKKNCVENETENIKEENLTIENSIYTLKNKQNSTMYCPENSCKHVKKEKYSLQHLQHVKDKCPNEKNKLLCQTRSRSLHSGIFKTCTNFKLFDTDQEIENEIPILSRLKVVGPDRYSMFKDMKYLSNKSSSRNNIRDDHDNFGKTRFNSSTPNSCLSQDICLCSDGDEPPTGVCKNKIDANILFSRNNLEILKKENKKPSHSLCNVTSTKQLKKDSEHIPNKLRTDTSAPPKMFDFTPNIKTDRGKKLEGVNLRPPNLPHDICTCSDEEEFPGSKCKFFTRKTEQVTHNKFDQIFRRRKPAEPLHTLSNKNYRASIETKNNSSKASTGVIWINSKSELRSENLNFSLQIASSGKPIKNEQTDSKCVDSNLYSNSKSAVNPRESNFDNCFNTDSNPKFREIAIKSAKGTPKVTNINEVCKTNIQQVTYKFIHEVTKERKDNRKQKCKCSTSKTHENIKHIPSKTKCFFDSTLQNSTSQDTNYELLNDLKRTAGSLLNVESLKSLCSFSGLKSSMNLFKNPKIPITNKAKPQAGKDDPRKFTACMLKTKKYNKPRRLSSKDTIVLNKLHTQKTVNY